MSTRTEQIDTMRKLTAELTALEYGWQHPHEVPPAYVEPRLQTYMAQNVQPDELHEHVEQLRARKGTMSTTEALKVPVNDIYTVYIDVDPHHTGLEPRQRFYLAYTAQPIEWTGGGSVRVLWPHLAVCDLCLHDTGVDSLKGTAHSWYGWLEASGAVPSHP
jgi:hypothetical protein